MLKKGVSTNINPPISHFGNNV